MMGNITINIWMILTVILSVGMVTIFVSSVYRGFYRCNRRIDEQNKSLVIIDQELEHIDGEITNIKVEQATIKAIQGIRSEDEKNHFKMAPVCMYQPQPQQNYVQPQPQQNYVQPQSQQNYVQPPLQQEFLQKEPIEQKPLQQEVPCQEAQFKQKEYKEIQQATQQLQENQKTLEPTSKPTYKQNRIHDIGFTEFQLPEEYEIERELTAHERSETNPFKNIEAKPQQRPAFIPFKEMTNPSKFNSLNDGTSRGGKRYSEEELEQRILD